MWKTFDNTDLNWDELECRQGQPLYQVLIHAVEISRKPQTLQQNWNQGSGDKERGLALEPQEVQTESNNPVIEDVKYLLKESAIRFLSEVKVSSIEMFGDAAFLSPGKTFLSLSKKLCDRSHSYQ